MNKRIDMNRFVRMEGADKRYMNLSLSLPLPLLLSLSIYIYSNMNK